jgi:hypothetical protein
MSGQILHAEETNSMLTRALGLSTLLACTLLSAPVQLASPAAADTRTIENPTATPSRTDEDVSAFTVDYQATRLTVRIHVENLSQPKLGDPTHWDVRLGPTPTDTPMGLRQPNTLRLSGTLDEDGTILTGGELTVANEQRDLPAGAVTAGRQGDDLWVSIDQKHVPWTSLYTSLEVWRNYGHFTYVGYEGGLGPVRISPQARSAVRLVLTPSRITVGRTRTTAAAEVTPVNASGRIRFMLDGREVGSSAVVNGRARMQLPLVSRTGSHRVSATFQPTDVRAATAATAAPATLAVVPVPPRATRTSVRLSKRTQVYGSRPASMAIRVSGNAAGKVSVFDRSKRLKTLVLRAGRASYRLPKRLKVGRHSLTVRFTPANPKQHQASTSAKVTVRVKRR